MIIRGAAFGFYAVFFYLGNSICLYILLVCVFVVVVSKLRLTRVKRVRAIEQTLCVVLAGPWLAAQCGRIYPDRRSRLRVL